MDNELRLSQDELFPPGTQRIETTTGTHIVLSPVPSPDPNQPLNWSVWRKTLHMTLLCTYTILIFAVLTVATPLWVAINDETGVSFDDLNNAYASSSGALAIGCIFFVPLALKYGRRPVYIVTALLMTASAIWQGRSQTTGDFIGSNIIAGLAGAVNEALFQVTVSDLFFVHQRASVNGLYLAAVCTGNYLGPVAAGYVADSQGWRWTFYYLTIFMAVTSIALIFALEESKFTSPLFLGQPASAAIFANRARPTSALPDNANNNTLEKDMTKSPPLESDAPLMTMATRNSIVETSSIPMHSYWHRHRLYTTDSPGTTSAENANNSFLRHILQPFQILVTFPAVAFAALQYGWLVSLLSVVAVTQATILPADPYDFSATSVGLMSLPPAIGAILGSLAGGPLVDLFSIYIAKRRHGIHEPETRLWLYMIPVAVGMVGGCLIYGLTIAEGLPWIANAIGAGLVGFALGACGDMALTYVQDSYQYILGDALVGVVFVRNAIATAMVFAVPPWMNNMGVYDMFVVIGVVSALVGLCCVPLCIWGRRWRAMLGGRYEGFARRQY